MDLGTGIQHQSTPRLWKLLSMDEMLAGGLLVVNTEF